VRVVSYASINQSLGLTVDEPGPGTAVLHVAGEVDMLTSPELLRTATQQLERGVHRLVVDLTDVVFLGTSGLAALVQTRSRARDHHCELWLVCATRQVRRPLEIAGIADLFHVAGTVGAALSGGSPDRR
jgi:anti-sigma B factor antagonist